MARNWLTIFTHIIFGVVGASTYKGLRSAQTDRDRASGHSDLIQSALVAAL